jgi:hypothetical protein
MIQLLLRCVTKIVKQGFKQMTYKTYEVKVYDNGNKSWHLNGKLHREDGHAVEWAGGDKHWYLNGNLHREDGPAIEWGDGDKHWYLNGKRHREDGPAVEYTDGDKAWYLNGNEYTEAKWKAKLNSVKELSVKEISDILGYEVKVVK